MGIPLIIMGLTFSLQMNDSLTLTISEGIICTSANNPGINFSISLENRFFQDYLAYNVGIFSEGSDIDSYYCDGKGSAGNYIFLYDSNGKQQYTSISLGKSIYDNPVTIEDVETIYDENKKLLIDTRIVIKSQSSFEMTKYFNLKRFDLKPGIYDLYVIYASGKFLYDFLGVDIINTHQQEFNAQLFQGCIKSNTVKLVVK